MRWTVHVLVLAVLGVFRRWDARPRGKQRAGAEAFAVAPLRWRAAQRNQARLSALPERARAKGGGGRGAGVSEDATTVRLLAAKGGNGASRGTRSKGNKTGGGFGKVATRPVPDEQHGPGRGRSTASPDKHPPPGEDGSVETTVVLDKWGLPPPTLDDVFPPLPDGTELIPVRDGASYTLEQMQAALRHVVPLSLDRHFDEYGVERDSAAGSGRNHVDGHGNPRRREPMRLRLLHQSPPVLAIENFFTPEECDATRSVVETTTQAAGPPVQVGSRTFAGAISRRTSTSWFCFYGQHPALLARAVHVLGLELPNMEEPQVVRYRPGQEFSFHYDQVPAHQMSNGGQRLATLLYVARVSCCCLLLLFFICVLQHRVGRAGRFVLHSVYLNTVPSSGGTTFRDLKGPDGTPLTVRPAQGSALLFFPADAAGVPDDRTLHCGEPLGNEEEKWIVQMWIHQHAYRASVPPHNRQEDALDSIEATARELGLIPELYQE